MSYLRCLLFAFLLLLPIYFHSTVQQKTSQHGENNNADIRQHVNQCRITFDLYKELRLLSDESGEIESKKRTCATPGCFFIYPPADDTSFMPMRFFKERRNSKIDFALQGCRSDIPFMLQRASFSKDIKLHRLLRYLRACFVLDKEKAKLIRTKHCQPEWSNKTESLSRRSWLEQNAYYTEKQCFFPFYNQKVFYASFGQHSEGRVVCCSDGRMDNDAFQKDECKVITEYIYRSKGDLGWRKGKDGQ